MKQIKIIIAICLFSVLSLTAACVKLPQALTTPTNVRIENGVLRWDKVEGADEYIVYNSFNGEEITVKTNEYDLSFIKKDGEYKIDVAAIRQNKKGKEQTAWVGTKYNYGNKKNDNPLPDPVPSTPTNPIITPPKPSIPQVEAINGLIFTKIEGREAYEVTKKKYETLESTVVIPETYNGLPVVKIARGAFIDDMSFVAGSTKISGFDDTIKKIVLPDTIEEIGEYAFASCIALEEINLPEGIKIIPFMTFSNCKFLSNITLPSSLETIGSSAFSNCFLTKITIPDNVKNIEDSAFINCKSLKQIELPENVTAVKSSLFNGCVSLQTVTLSEKTETIGEGAFQNCINLRQINLPTTLKTIGLNAFYGCNSLLDIVFPENLDNIEYIEKNNFETTAWYNNLPNGLIIINDKYLFGYKGELPEDGKLVIPQYIEKIITKSTFSGLNVKSVVFECELDEISEGFFQKCSLLTEVVLKGNIKSIPKSAFSRCTSLTKVVLPDSVENVGENAFEYSGVTNLDFLPLSVKSIEKNAFSHSALESANLPKNAVLMGISVFGYCKSLTSAKIYSGTYLPASTFVSCEKLTDVTLNDGMEEIQQSAFRGCVIKNLDFLPSTIKIIGKSAFMGCPLEEIRYPKGLQSAEDIFIKKISVKTHILPVALTQAAFYVQAENLYYEGTQEQFDSTEKKIRNEVDTSKITIYYYAESKDDIDDPSKNYWHYAADGKTPVIWEL